MGKKHKKPRILTFIDYYLPGFKAGGPIRTISNMVSHLGKEFDILILTRDRDLHDSKPYLSVRIDEWNNIGEAKVYYVSKLKWTPRSILRFLNKTQHDLLYLNSFFSPWCTGLPLLLRRLGLYRKVPVIIAPRGEFSPRVLTLKHRKKSIYIQLVKLFGLYNGLIWQASSNKEADEIRIALGERVADVIKVAPNLLPKKQKSAVVSPLKLSDSSTLGLVFLSRISQKKNLHFLLSILRNVQREIELSIYGPKEDLHYWSKIERLIDLLPKNVKVNYFGEVKQKDVPEIFSRYDLFAFPTMGENFGHVIYESLAVGTPVLLSDQTPWQPDLNGALEVLPLDSNKWTEAVDTWASLGRTSLQKRKQAAVKYAENYQAQSNAIQQNLELFHTALNISDD